MQHCDTIASTLVAIYPPRLLITLKRCSHVLLAASCLCWYRPCRYNSQAYPLDQEAKAGIDVKVWGIGGACHLAL